MSQQEMFPPQENRPPRQDNADPHEQPYKQQSRGDETADAGQASYEAGYRDSRDSRDSAKHEVDGRRGREGAPIKVYACASLAMDRWCARRARAGRRALVPD